MKDRLADRACGESLAQRQQEGTWRFRTSDMASADSARQTCRAAEAVAKRSGPDSRTPGAVGPATTTNPVRRSPVGRVSTSIRDRSLARTAPEETRSFQ